MRGVVDSSVVLAYLLDEPGGELLVGHDGPFLLSTVNLTEVLTVTMEHDLGPELVLRILNSLPLVISSMARTMRSARRGCVRSAAIWVFRSVIESAWPWDSGWTCRY